MYQGAIKRLVIIDMGIGRTLARPTELQTRAFCGTKGYAPPEQELGLRVDLRADLYAVGVILHEMLTGNRGSYTYMTYSGHVGVATLLRALLQRDPAQRPISANATIQRINAMNIVTR